MDESNDHKKMADSQIHVAKGFSPAINGYSMWKSELGEQAWDNRNVLPTALALAVSSSAPPTEVNGDIYLLNNARPSLNVNTIAWQSANTVRYTFNSTPDLTSYVVGDYISVTSAGSTPNNGNFIITNINTGSYYIDVTNLAILDNTYDEGSDSPAIVTSTLSNWDGCPQNSWVRFNSVQGKWFCIIPALGVMCFNKALGYFTYYNGTEWINIGTSDLTGVVFLLKIILSSQQMKTGFSVPIAVSVVPGTTEFIDVISGCVEYTAGDGLLSCTDITLITDTATDCQFKLGFVLDPTINGFLKMRPNNSSQSQIVKNKRLYIQLDQDSAAGTGRGTVYIAYMRRK